MPKVLYKRYYTYTASSLRSIWNNKRDMPHVNSSTSFRWNETTYRYPTCVNFSINGYNFTLNSQQNNTPLTSKVYSVFSSAYTDNQYHIRRRENFNNNEGSTGSYLLETYYVLFYQGIPYESNSGYDTIETEYSVQYNTYKSSFKDNILAERYRYPNNNHDGTFWYEVSKTYKEVYSSNKRKEIKGLYDPKSNTSIGNIFRYKNKEYA